jgi:hypothetical protein
MPAWRAICETVFHFALAIWLGVVISAGAFAAIVFPTMKKLDPHLPGFANYDGQHWLIAGGQVGQRIFLLADIVQFACAIVSVSMMLCMFVLLGLPKRRPANIIRALGLTVAFACAAGEIIIIGPAINRALNLFWHAAEAGLTQQAASKQADVDDLHPIASWLLSGAAVGVLIALVAGLWSLAKPWSSATPGSAAKRSPYPEPALAKGRRA